MPAKNEFFFFSWALTLNELINQTGIDTEHENP